MVISLTLTAKCNEILLKSKSPQYRNRFFVLVEGCTDIRFFNKHFSYQTVSFESVLSGKPEVEKSINYLIDNGLTKVFGVCDADFDHIERKEYNNIYLTDFHDLEMFFIESNCLHKIFCEYLTNKNESDYDKVKEDIIKVCYKIGIIRFLNFREQAMKLNFKGMNFGEFIEFIDSKIEFDIHKFVQFILNRSKNTPREYTKEYIISKYQELTNVSFDYRHLCNGHDFVNILAIVIRDMSGKTNINQERLEENMRIGYELECFRETILYNRISSHFHSAI
ncbi:DUF4435 domain-containing protein [Aggregatibacter actinomycetemcomitans]|nr:DUF4435 domain-containing protein [Aggregatibacter actinomycetemcomitans]EHK89966.1 hypothetical protein RHAA1_08818 [Aggregatibacter actinomycetemcomitans RhAA1]